MAAPLYADATTRTIRLLRFVGARSDQSLPERDQHGLGAVGDAELRQDIGNVIADRAFAEPEGGCDLRVRKSVRHEAQNLTLSHSQRIGRGQWRYAHTCDVCRWRQRRVQ